MGSMSSTRSTAYVPVKAVTQRTLAKQQTRARILEAARLLFSAQGYEDTTIRDIATQAGMTTGAVFANFTDKSDLFHEIVGAGMEILLAKLRDAIAQGRTVEQSLLKMFMAGYAHYIDHLHLARAALSASRTKADGQTLRTGAPTEAQCRMIAELLRQGVERGEFREDANLELRSQMLYEAYLSNYPRLIGECWSQAFLEHRMADQVGILLDGIRPARPDA